MTVRKKEAGFTLTEVLIAVLIAAAGLGGIYMASIRCLRQVWMAREASRAVLAVDYEMENLRTMPWSHIAAQGSSYAMTVSDNPAMALLDGASGTVGLAPFDGNSNVVQATVHLAWTGYRGALNTNLSAAIIISKNGFLR